MLLNEWKNQIAISTSGGAPGSSRPNFSAPLCRGLKLAVSRYPCPKTTLRLVLIKRRSGLDEEDVRTYCLSVNKMACLFLRGGSSCESCNPWRANDICVKTPACTTGGRVYFTVMKCPGFALWNADPCRSIFLMQIAWRRKSGAAWKTFSIHQIENIRY